MCGSDRNEKSLNNSNKMKVNYRYFLNRHHFFYDSFFFCSFLRVIKFNKTILCSILPGFIFNILKDYQYRSDAALLVIY